MSHLTTIQREFRDVPALRAALKDLGLTLGGRGKVRFYYGGYAPAAGATEKDQRMEECDYVVAPPKGSKYGLGFRKVKGGALQPVGDEELFTGSYGKCDSARALYGENLAVLYQRYAYHGVLAQARLKGYVVRQEKAVNGDLILRVQT